MSSNNGQKLLVFGLGFAQHDNRNVQRVLRHYDRLPDSPGSRAALFVELTKLGKDLEKDEGTRAEAQLITDWMRLGGDFPLGEAPAPINAADSLERTSYNQREAYQPAAYLDPRFGPGHILGDPEDAEDEQISDQPAEAPQNSHEGGVDTAMDLEDEINPEANNNYGGWGAAADDLPRPEDEPEDLEPGFPDQPDEDHMEVDRWGLPPTAFGHHGGQFQGRGRTFDDIDESAAVIEDQDVHPVMPLNVNRPANVPRLRGEQQWRGNNVHGLGRGLGGLGGMPHPGMLGHMGHAPRQAARRRPRPRMEHDLEGEDVHDGLNEWHIAPGGFAVGPGRTLNDAEPAQDEGGLQQPAFQEPDSDDYVSEGGVEEYEDKDETRIECPICLEEYPPSGFPKKATVTRQCDHPDKPCLQCLDSSITSIVESGALHLLACPVCPQKLTRWNIKEYATKSIYERYKYLKQQASNPGHYISCTNTNCGGSQAHDSNGPNGPMMVCKFCQAQTCAKHRRPWHEGQTCGEYDMDPVQMERLEEEEATAKLLATEDTSICPKCGQGVTKTEGCDHMSCQCGTEWCYVVSIVHTFRPPFLILQCHYPNPH